MAADCPENAFVASPTHCGSRGEFSGTPGQSWVFQTGSSVDAAALQLPQSRDRVGTGQPL